MKIMTIKRISDTKECPYCAETIKRAAKVCRFCGRDLEAEQSPDLLDKAITRYTSKGWQIISQSDTAIHLKKPKAWSMLLIVGGLISTLVGFFFPPLLIIGIGALLLSVLDHVIRSEKTLHITLNQLQDGTAPSGDTETNWLLIGLGILALVLCASALYLT